MRSYVTFWLAGSLVLVTTEDHAIGGAFDSWPDAMQWAMTHRPADSWFVRVPIAYERRRIDNLLHRR